MMERTFYNEAQLRDFAAEFGRGLKAGDVVGLSGALGSGKTTFVKAVVCARVAGDPATSPSFTFWHRYAAAPPIDHLDLYRVDDPRELAELGLDDAFDGSSIVLVEWSERGSGVLPPLTHAIEIDGKGDGPRTVRVQRA
jgi:tRNA threonylcarbamoyl adenosine modification protein YjeE